MNFENAYILKCFIFIFCFGYVKSLRKTKYVDGVNDVNSDINLDSLQLLAKYGKTPQKHAVVTEDGYVLGIPRIPNKGPAVLMVHGIGDSSDSWLVTDPSSSLAYQLSDLGFDIWLYNARGNRYSQEHVKNLPDKQYWDFSYDEMGSLDMPAVIDYVLTITGQSKLYYVGFSQGTTLLFILCSLKPEYNDKIQHAVLFAPVAWLTNTKYPYMSIFAKNSDLLKSFFDGIGVYKLFENNFLLKLFHAKVCRSGVPENVFCELEYVLSYGVRNLTNLNVDRLSVISTHIPAGVSTKTFVHFFQTYLSKQFQRYDYGASKNMELYGSSKPPEYELSAVTVPISIFVSETDWYSTVEDVKNLTGKLRNVVNYFQFNETLEFSHLEFVYGSRSKTLINDPTINILLNDFYKNIRI